MTAIRQRWIKHILFFFKFEYRNAPDSSRKFSRISGYFRAVEGPKRNFERPFSNASSLGNRASKSRTETVWPGRPGPRSFATDHEPVYQVPTIASFSSRRAHKPSRKRLPESGSAVPVDVLFMALQAFLIA